MTTPKSTSPVWNTGWMAIAASAEVVFPGQPLEFLKTQQQLRRTTDLTGPKATTSWNPLRMYRGFMANLSGMVPSTVMQVVTAQVAAKTLYNKTENFTLKEQTNCALISASVVALYQTPNSLVFVQQQKYPGSLLEVSRRIARLHGVSALWVGLLPMTVREMIFTISYQVAGPRARTALEKDLALTPPLASLIAYGGTGLIGGVLSHPFDTVKTLRQMDHVDPNVRESLTRCFKQVVQRAPFAGVVWRSCRFVGAIGVYDIIGNRVKRFIESYLT